MARPLKVRFQEIASHLTGLSIPFFGISWIPPEPERKAVRRLINFLEDRRALFIPYHLQIEAEVAESLLKIREELTATLSALPEDSQAIGSIRAMRAACRRFLTDENPGAPDVTQQSDPDVNHNFLISLGELRSSFGIHIGLLAAQYGIDVEGDLASVLPPRDED